MRRIFVDTVGFLALWNVRDPYHAKATAAFIEATADGPELFTTEFVLLECANAASRTPFRRDVIEVREQFAADGKLIIPTERDCAEAWGAYSRERAGQPGVVDHVSFIVMRRLGIEDAFTNDLHFKLAGFNTMF